MKEPARDPFDNPFAQVEDAHVRRQIWWSLIVVIALGFVAYQEVTAQRQSEDRRAPASLRQQARQAPQDSQNLMLQR